MGAAFRFLILIIIAMFKKGSMIASLCLIAGLNSGAYAQVGQGGFPLSFSNPIEVSLSPVTLNDATFNALLNGEGQKASERYEVGWSIPASIDLMSVGIWKENVKGKKVYQVALKVPNAKALALYYRDFYLPEGVSMYLYNQNRKQVLGAYNNTTSPESRTFSNEPIIGDVVTLELNIDPGVNVKDIALNLDFVGAYYRGVETEAALYADETPLLNDPPIGSTASCHVNAMCPQGDDQPEARKATLRIVITGGPGTPMGYCSGTLINNTGNEPNGRCAPLFLTASHCDGENGMTDNHFRYWQFRFNYQIDGCTTGDLPTATSSPTLTSGAKFKARSFYPTFTTSNPDISSLVQDFLLLELNGELPTGYHLIGWNRATNLASDPNQFKFYGFHHPSGDVKKMSLASEVGANGTFNQNTVTGTHWDVQYDLGGTSPGSSGSGLFDTDGLLVGDLSGGATGNCPADGRKYGADALYSKLSYGWENAFDQTEFPQHAGATSRLKDHLDPLNLGLMKLTTAESDQCSDFTSVKVKQFNNNDIIVYPVPANNGVINIQTNLKDKATFACNIVDVSGRTVKSFTMDNKGSNIKAVDVSSLSAGVYFITMNSELGFGQYKFVISK
jgi:lysyl endopeptidase